MFNYNYLDVNVVNEYYIKDWFKLGIDRNDKELLDFLTDNFYKDQPMTIKEKSIPLLPYCFYLYDHKGIIDIILLLVNKGCKFYFYDDYEGFYALYNYLMDSEDQFGLKLSYLIFYVTDKYFLGNFISMYGQYFDFVPGLQRLFALKKFQRNIKERLKK